MKKTIIFGAIAALFFTACSKEASEIDTDTAVLTFKDATVDAGLQTKASPGYSAYTDPFNVNLAAVSGIYTATISTFTYSSGWTGSPVINLSPTSTTITGWAPTGLSATSTSAPTVFALTPQVYAAAADLVYFKDITVSSTASTVALLQLDRAYSMVTLKLTKNASYPGAGNFTALSLGGSAGVSSIDISDGSYTRGSAAALSMASGLASQQIPTAGISALVVPQNSVSLTIDCTIDGRAYSNLAITGVTNLEPAKNYVVTLTLSGTSLTITEVEIQNWTDVSGGDVTIQ